MIRTFKYRLYPTAEQQVLLSKHFGSSRWIYNWALQTKKEAYTQTGKSPSCFDLQKQITQLKKQEETSWLKEVNSQSLQAAVVNLDAAYNNFFSGRAKFPRFKTKQDSTQSYTLPDNVVVDWGTEHIKLPKFQDPIKFIASQKFPGDPRKCVVTKNASGQYHISIVFEDGNEIPTKPADLKKEDVLGIDVGIKSFAVTSEGEVIDNPSYFRKSEKRLALAQRRLSHKKKGSNNYKKEKIKVARCHLKIANQRKDFLHKLSTRWVSENQAIARETLNVRGMLQNHNLSKSISDAGWSHFDSYLQYKCDLQGKWFLTIGQFAASSRTCHKCGYTHRTLALSDRVWVCPVCGEVHDRDVNASLNIRNWAYVGWLNGIKVPSDTGELMLDSGVKAGGRGSRRGNHRSRTSDRFPHSGNLEEIPSL
jgi:putative transposase